MMLFIIIDHLLKIFSFSSGKIRSYLYNNIDYEIPTIMGAMGSPIILGNNNYYVIGVHLGRLIKFNKSKYGQNLYSIIN